MSMVIGMTFFAAVVLLPLIWRVIAIRRPLKVATGGVSFDAMKERSLPLPGGCWKLHASVSTR